jgi:hypothetical protein
MGVYDFTANIVRRKSDYRVYTIEWDMGDLSVDHFKFLPSNSSTNPRKCPKLCCKTYIRFSDLPNFTPTPL